MRRAATASSSRTGTWATSFTWEEGTNRALRCSQRKVLRTRRQRVRAAGLQALELLVPAREVPDFEVAALADEHHLAGDARESPHFGGNQESACRIEVEVECEADEEPAPLA